MANTCYVTHKYPNSGSITVCNLTRILTDHNKQYQSRGFVYPITKLQTSQIVLKYAMTSPLGLYRIPKYGVED